MKRTMFIFFVYVCLCFSCKNVDDIKLYNSKVFETCVEDYVSKWDYTPALEIAIYGKEGALTYHYRNGYFSITNKLRVNEESLFILYSITKSMTASAVIDLINTGKLSLDDTVGDFFQDLNPIYFNIDATIEELLTHRSGIQDYTENPALIYNNPFSKENTWNPFIILDYISIPADIRGTFIYSSANYILLGLIIERITGISMCDYLQEKIFQPCNVTMYLYPQEEIKVCNIVHPHVYPNTFMGLYGDGKTPIDISTQIKNINELSLKCSWAAGGVVSNAKNTVIWGYELLSEKGKIDCLIRKKILDSVSQFSNETSLSNAYGFGVRRIEHSGYALVGSYGRSFGCENLMFYNKEKDVCIVILSSSNTKSDGNPNIDELMFSIFDSF